MLVIGNGESRQGIDINTRTCTKVGCNAIYRDFFVDHLVCVDRRMVQESINAGYNTNTKIYTRKDWLNQFSKEDNLYVVPDLPYKGNLRQDDPFHWGSGPYALLIGAMNSLGNVEIIGFDLYSKTTTVNNIYKDTNNYSSKDKRAVDPRYWIHQCAMVFKYFPDISFKMYVDKEWNMPDLWKNSNVKVDLLDKF